MYASIKRLQNRGVCGFCVLASVLCLLWAILLGSARYNSAFHFLMHIGFREIGAVGVIGCLGK